MINNYNIINIPIKINMPCHIKMIYITNNTSEDSVNSEHSHSLQGSLCFLHTHNIEVGEYSGVNHKIVSLNWHAGSYF